MPAGDHVNETVNAIYESESRRVLATLIRLLGDFDVAEEAMHDAFRAALEQWPRDGVPGNPRAWLISAGRFKAIDGIRRRSRFDALDEISDEADLGTVDPEAWAEKESVEDDRLRLVFTCCHPSLAPDAQVRFVAELVERVKSLAPAQAVDGLEASGRYQPRARVSRHTVARPLLQRGSEGVVHRFLGDVEVAHEAD